MATEKAKVVTIRPDRTPAKGDTKYSGGSRETRKRKEGT